MLIILFTIVGVSKRKQQLRASGGNSKGSASPCSGTTQLKLHDIPGYSVTTKKFKSSSGGSSSSRVQDKITKHKQKTFGDIEGYSIVPVSLRGVTVTPAPVDCGSESGMF
jgi:hypothetical protein